MPTIKDDLYRSFTPGTYSEETDSNGKVMQRKVRAIFTSEDPVVVYDWNSDEYIREVLTMDGMVIPANRQVPLLDNHSRYEGSIAVKGSCRNIENMKNGTSEADVYFSSLADDVATLAREGHLTDLSVGYKTDSTNTVWIEPNAKANVNGKEYDNTGSNMRMAIRTVWHPFEISTTPIGADARAKFRAAQMDVSKTNSTKERKMPEQVLPEQGSTTASATSDANIRMAAEKEAREAERARITGIQTAAREFGIEDEFCRQFIDKGVQEVEAVRQLTLEAQRRLKPAPQGGSDIVLGKDDTDKFREATLTGLLLRSGYDKNKLDSKLVAGVEKSEFRSGSVLSLARYCLDREGVRGVAYMEPYEVAQMILGGRSVTAQGTGDFSYILAAAANKFLMKGYEEENTTWQYWFGKQPLNDFKQNKLVNMSGFSDMEKIPEGANPSWGRFSDKGEYITLFKIGKAFVLSMEAITNDDKSAFTRIPEAFARSIARKKERDAYEFVYGTAGAGPTMNEDATAMFHSNHANIGSTAAPSTKALRDARKLLRSIKLLAPDKTSKTQYTNAPIKYIVTGTTNESLWEEVLNSPTSFGNSSGVNNQANPAILNPFAKMGIQLITTPIIDELSTTVWWAAADANVAQHFVMASLAGEEAPQIRSAPSEIGQARGIVWDCMSIYAVGASDWRGVVYNAGA